MVRGVLLYGNREYVLDEKAVVGRSGTERCDVNLDDLSVSRKHATVTRDGAEYLLSDWESKAGTTVNGRRLRKSTEWPLKHGDKIKFGDCLVLFEKRESDEGVEKCQSVDEGDEGTVLPRPQPSEKEEAGADRDVDPGSGRSGTPPVPRLWTADYCPNYGRVGIEYITHSEFEKRSIKAGERVGRKTVSRRIHKGVYCANPQGRVPWCPECRVRTPEGQGDKDRWDPNEAPEKLWGKEWERDMLEWVRGILERELPGMTAWTSGLSDSNGPAMDFLSSVVHAVLEVASEEGEELTRDRVEEIARDKIKCIRADEDLWARENRQGGDMEHRPASGD